VVFGLIEGQRYDWGRISSVDGLHLGSTASAIVSIPGILIAGVILLILFVLWESRQEEPLLPLSLFRDRNFSVANAVSAIVAFGMLGLFLPMTIFLQSVRGMSAQDAGVVLVPVSLTSMFIGPLAGRLSDRFGGKYFLFSGLLLFSLGFGLVITVASLSSTGLSFTLPLIVAGIGMGCTFAPMVTMAMRNIAPTQAGAASGFINTIRQVGATIGSAVVGAVLQNRLATELHSQAVAYSSQVPAQFRAKFIYGYSHASSGGFQLGRGQTGGAKLPANLPHAVAQHLAAISRQVFDHAYLNAMKPSLALPIAVMLLGALVTLLMRSDVPGAAQAQTAPEGGPSRYAAAGE
jgi:MFS family permease